MTNNRIPEPCEVHIMARFMDSANQAKNPKVLERRALSALLMAQRYKGLGIIDEDGFEMVSAFITDLKERIKLRNSLF